MVYFVHKNILLFNLERKKSENVLINADENKNLNIIIPQNIEANNSNENEKTASSEKYDFKHVKDIALYNIDFNENYNLSLRNPYFDSEKDDYKRKQYYEYNYRNTFVQAIIFLVFCSVFIVMLFFNTLPPTSR